MPQTCGASESSATSCESRAREGGAESPTGGSWAALPLKGLVWVLVESPPQSQEGSSSYPAPPVCPTPVCPVESAAPVAFLSEWLALTLTPHPGPSLSLMLTRLGSSVRSVAWGWCYVIYPCLCRWVHGEGGRERRCTSVGIIIAFRRQHPILMAGGPQRPASFLSPVYGPL